MKSDDLQRVVNLMYELVSDYKKKHDGLFPTQKELAEGLGIGRSKTSLVIKEARKAGLKPEIITRRTIQKRKKYVSDEEIKEAYFRLARPDRLPSCQEVADVLGIDGTTVSRRIRQINQKDGAIITRGSGKRRKRKNFDPQIVARGIQYFEAEHRFLPFTAELASFLGINQNRVTHLLKRVNIERLSKGQPFLFTRKKSRTKKPIGEKPFLSSLIEIEDATKILIEWIRWVLLERTNSINRLAESHYSLSVGLLRDFLVASQKSLFVFRREDRFLLTEGPSRCTGDRIFISHSVADPAREDYLGSRLLAENIFFSMVSALFISPLKEEIKEAVIARSF